MTPNKRNYFGKCRKIGYAALIVYLHTEVADIRIKYHVIMCQVARHIKMRPDDNICRWILTKIQDGGRKPEVVITPVL